MEYFNFERHEDGMLFAFLNNPRDRMNTLSEPVITELEKILDEIETDHFAKAFVLISSKADNFIVGADIRIFDEITDLDQASAVITRLHALYNRISNLQFPAVAAINGPCLGGGLELALACHFRLATNSGKTVLGLPEIKLGLIPAAGGTQRLTRRAGVRQALPLMLAGKVLNPFQARALGLVDIIVYPGDLPGTVKRSVPFLRKKFPRKISYPPLFSVDWLLRNISPLRRYYFSAVRSQVAKQTGEHYPAPFRLIDCVEAGISGTISDGFKTEAEAIGPLVLSPQSRSLRRLFFLQTGLKKKQYGKEERSVQEIGVLGSGLMGTGIATVSVQNGFRVVLKDVAEQNLSNSLRDIWNHLDRRVRLQRRNPVQRDRLYSLVVPTMKYEQLSRTNIVIEAVFEDLALKREVLRSVESHTSAECIFASNTSAIPIRRIAEASDRPENVIGMHYFSPVPKMPLLEIVAAEKSADWVLATAVSVGRRQGKSVIVVKDGPGFYTTRILMPFVLEGIKLLEEGVSVRDVDRAMTEFGFPVGPLKLLDEVGIDVAAHIANEMADFFSVRGLRPPAALDEVLRLGFAGRKKGSGFYLYDQKFTDKLPFARSHERPENPKIYRLFGGDGKKSIGIFEIQKRLTFLMLNEAALCLQESVIAGPEDGDLGAVLGLGFPPFLGGPFYYLDSSGLGRTVSEMEKLASNLGPRFQPASILLQMAERQEKFYRNA